MSTCGACGEDFPVTQDKCSTCGLPRDPMATKTITVDELLHGFFHDAAGAEVVGAAGSPAGDTAPADELENTKTQTVFTFDELPTPETLDLGVDVRYEFPSAPDGEHAVVHALISLAPRGPSLVDPKTGPVAHVILGLDVSASMDVPSKYPVLMQALTNMLIELQDPASPEVLVSIVLFAKGTETLVEAQRATDLDPREVVRQIKESRLLFGRYTDIVGALKRTGHIALKSHRVDRALPLRVYILTDGKPQDMEGAERVMARVRKLPADVDALAFGSDADVRSLKQLLCGNRGGTVKHVRTETVGEAFDRIADVATRVVAKRSLLDIELRPGVVGGTAYRYRPGRHSYGKRAFRAGRRFSTDLGTLESGREYSLVVQVRLPARESETETEIGTLTVRVPGHGGPQTFETLLSIPRHPGKEASLDIEPEVAEALEILEALGDADPAAQIRALKARRKLYQKERRDPHVTLVLEKAISALENTGSLDSLSRSERAILVAHTRTTYARRVKVDSRWGR